MRTLSRKRRGEGGTVSQPLVIGYHLIWTGYGWWLPNDPRGSGLIRKHRLDAEDMIAMLQEASRDTLVAKSFCDVDHPVWANGGWKVFLDHPDEIRRTIRYIEGNPIQIGLPKQSWTFVKLYDGWPLHLGHSPNSPYARALKAAGRYP